MNSVTSMMSSTHFHISPLYLSLYLFRSFSYVIVSLLLSLLLLLCLSLFLTFSFPGFICTWAPRGLFLSPLLKKRRRVDWALIQAPLVCLWGRSIQHCYSWNRCVSILETQVTKVSSTFWYRLGIIGDIIDLNRRNKNREKGRQNERGEKEREKEKRSWQLFKKNLSELSFKKAVQCNVFSLTQVN